MDARTDPGRSRPRRRGSTRSESHSRYPVSSSFPRPPDEIGAAGRRRDGRSPCDGARPRATRTSPRATLAGERPRSRPSRTSSACAPKTTSAASAGSLDATSTARSHASTSCTESATTCSSKKRRRVRIESQPTETVAVRPIRQARRHLERGEMADQCSSPAAVEAEQGDQVHRRERDAGQPIDVRPVGAVEARGDHRRAEQLGVHPRRVAAAVLVVLDLHHHRLRRALQSRDHPRMRIGLLQLIGRPVRSGTRETARGWPRVRGTTESESSPGGGDRAERPRRPRRAPPPNVRSRDGGRLEHRLELASNREDRRVPLEIVGNTREPSVVELVGEVERQVQVVVA